MADVWHPTNTAELMNVSLWTSASRIYASHRMQIAGRGGAIPRDLAAVVTELRRREESRFGGFVGLLRSLDADLNEAYRRQRARDMPVVPAGQSVLDPFYHQYTVLLAAPEIEDEWVWRDMPDELLAWNAPDLTDEERAVLQDLGYEAAATRAAAGQPVYRADPAMVAEAKRYAADLSYLTGFGVPKVGGAVAIIQAVSWGLAALLGLTIIIEYIKAKPRWKEAESEASRIAAQARENQQRFEVRSRLFDFCMKRLEAGQAQLADCNTIAAQLGALQPWDRPPALPGGECGFGTCWPWGLAGVGLGVFGGWWLGKRYGLVPKE